MTITVPIVNTDWTQVNSQLKGNVSNFGERDVVLREDESKPDVSIENGFILRPGGNVPFSLSSINNIWARSDIAPTVVLVSVGINPVHTTTDFYGNVALGLVDGVTSVPFIVGVHPNVTNSFNDISDFGDMVFPTAAESLEVFSNDSNDTLAGSGQRIIIYQGYDSNFDLTTPQAILLNGGVASISGTHIRTRTFFGFQAGSTGQNEGAIDLRAVSGGALRSQILFDADDGGNGVSFNSFYTTPANKTALLLKTSVFSPKGEDFIVRSRTRNNAISNPSVNVGGPIPVYQNSVILPLQTAVIPEKVDFWFQAKSSNVGPFTITTLAEIVEFDNTTVGLSALNQQLSVM